MTLQLCATAGKDVDMTVNLQGAVTYTSNAVYARDRVEMAPAELYAAPG